MVVIKKINEFCSDTRGDAIVVEATILFPIIIMIFAALVLLAMYLPQRAVLQNAAQVAAYAVATEHSDTWIVSDNNGNLGPLLVRPYNVYGAAFRSPSPGKAEAIAKNVSARSLVSTQGEVKAVAKIKNYLVYQEVVVTVSQTIRMPGAEALRFIGFPTELNIVQEAKAVVQNPDEFVRNVDIVMDLTEWLLAKFGISLYGALDSLNSNLSRIGLIKS